MCAHLTFLISEVVWPDQDLSYVHGELQKPCEVVWFTQGQAAREGLDSRWGLESDSCVLATRHAPIFYTPCLQCLQEVGELWRLMAFVCSMLGGFGGQHWGEKYDSCSCACVWRDKKGVHQRGLCQWLNFLYFRAGSYLNYFIDFLLPCKSSLSPGWTAVLP